MRQDFYARYLFCRPAMYSIASLQQTMIVIMIQVCYKRSMNKSNSATADIYGIMDKVYYNQSSTRKNKSNNKGMLAISQDSVATETGWANKPPGLLGFFSTVK